MGLTKMYRFYDGKQLWENYMSWGKAASHRKLVEWCNTNGMTNPATGRASQMGAFWAMWRFAFNNPEEAYVSYKKFHNEYGSFPTFEEFLHDVLRHVKGRPEIKSEKHITKFIDKYNLGVVEL